MNNKILYILLILFIITSVNVNNDDFINSPDTENSDTSNFVYYAQREDFCSEMDEMTVLEEFQDYLQKNGINKYDYELNLVPSSSSVHPQVIIHTPHHEFHYSITKVTNNSITATNVQGNTRILWNRFKVANKCGSTLGKVQVSYFAYMHIGDLNTPIIIKQRKSIRYNLVNNGVLNYAPIDGQTHATISIFKKSSDIIPCTIKVSVGLGRWHIAYVKKDSNYYIYLA